MEAMANKQHGVSLSGLLKVVVVLIFVAAGAIKIVPAYLNDRTISSKFKEVANDPDMKNATVHDIKASYSRRIAISNITDVKADDIEVTKDGGGIVLSASYSVKIPLAGNASLLLEFSPSSTAK